MNAIQLSKTAAVPRRDSQVHPNFRHPKGSSAQIGLALLQLNVIPEKLTEWVSASVVEELAVEAVRTLFWTDEPASDQIASNVSDGIRAKLATAIFSFALGMDSWKEIAEQAISNENLAPCSGATRTGPHQMHRICAQHPDLLKRCLARVFERAWVLQHGGCDIGFAATIAFMPAVFQARYAANFRRLFHNEAEQRVWRAFGSIPYTPSGELEIGARCANATSIEALNPCEHCSSRRTGPKRTLCWVLVGLLVFAMILICRAEDNVPTEAKPRTTQAAPDPGATSSSQPQPQGQEDLGYMLIEGKTNKILRVHSADPVAIFAIFENQEGSKGGRKIPRQDLQPQLRANYPYDASKAEEYRKQQTDAAARQMASAAHLAVEARVAAKEAMDKGTCARIETLRRRDVELQKKKNILDSLPKGNGRRLRSRQISNEQERIRKEISQLEGQLE